MNQFRKNLIYILVIITLIITPLIFIKNSEFGGADGKAKDIISEIDPNYKVWAKSPMKPPGGETETLLFALQAAIGSGVIFYILGYYKGKKSNVNR